MTSTPFQQTLLEYEEVFKRSKENHTQLLLKEEQENTPYQLINRQKEREKRAWKCQWDILGVETRLAPYLTYRPFLSFDDE